MIITTSIKYAALAMRADNPGEGGGLALTARRAIHGRHRPVLMALGVLGAARLYGDGAITPTVSVLSALEGLRGPLLRSGRTCCRPRPRRCRGCWCSGRAGPR